MKTEDSAPVLWRMTLWGTMTPVHSRRRSRRDFSPMGGLLWYPCFSLYSLKQDNKMQINLKDLPEASRERQTRRLQHTPHGQYYSKLNPSPLDVFIFLTDSKPSFPKISSAVQGHGVSLLPSLPTLQNKPLIGTPEHTGISQAPPGQGMGHPPFISH